MSELVVGLAVGATLRGSVNNVFQQTEQRTTRLGQAVTAMQARSKRLQVRLRGLEHQQQQTGGSSVALGRDIERVGRQLDRTRGKARQYQASLRNLGNFQQARQRAGAAVQRGGAALAAGGYAAGRLIGSELDRERAEVRLGTVLRGSDDRERDIGLGRAHARKTVQQGRTLLGETELLDIQYQLNSAGLGAEASRAGSELVAKLSTVTSGVPAQVASVVGVTMNNLGDTLTGTAAERMTRIGDVLAQTQMRYQIDNFHQLGEGMAEVAPMAVTAKLALDQTATAIGVLNDAGIQGSESGTAMKAFLRQLAEAAPKQLGFAVVRDAEGMLDLGATVEGLRQSLAGLDTDARNVALQKAFGEEGLGAAVTLMGKLQKFRDGMAALEVADGLVDEENQRFLDSAAGQMDILRNQTAVLGRVLAMTLLPAALMLGGAGIAVTGWLGDTIEQFPILGTAIGTATIAVAGFIATAMVVRTIQWGVAGWRTLGGVIAGARGNLITFRKSALATRALALGSTLAGWARGGLALLARGLVLAAGKAWALTAALLANPIVLIGVAIAGAAVLIYKYWEPISGFFKQLWSGVVNVFTGVWGHIRDSFGGVVESWAAVFTDFSWAAVGKAIMQTLASGIIWPGPLGLALKSVLGKAREMLPFSDARTGPLSDLTASGAAILGTLGAGVQRAGAEGLSRPLGVALAGVVKFAEPLPAALASGIYDAFRPAAQLGREADRLLHEPARDGGLRGAPAGATYDAFRPAAQLGREADRLLHEPARDGGLRGAPAGATYDNSIHGGIAITIRQQPGENADGLADRLMEAIERRQALRRRGALHDVL